MTSSWHVLENPAHHPLRVTPAGLSDILRTWGALTSFNLCHLDHLLAAVVPFGQLLFNCVRSVPEVEYHKAHHARAFLDERLLWSWAVWWIQGIVSVDLAADNDACLLIDVCQNSINSTMPTLIPTGEAKGISMRVMRKDWIPVLSCRACAGITPLSIGEGNP